MEILTILYDANLIAFSDAELPGVGGATVSFTICTKDKERDVRIISDGSIQYIVISDSNGNRICKKAKAVHLIFRN